MKPEQYWINRGKDVIGTDVLREGDNARQAATYKAIANWIVRNDYIDVLDVGCNVAALAMFLRSAGFFGRYIGLDSNPNVLDEAYPGAEIVIGNLSKLAYEARSFDTVVAKDLIEHQKSYRVLREIFRVAAKHVITSTYIPWTDEPEQIIQHADGYYTNRYCLKDVTAFGQRCGFNLIETLLLRETNGTPNAVYVWERAQ